MKIFLEKYGIYLISTLFFILYATLSLVRHNHFLSVYDLSVVDQIMWKYSRFLQPTTTIHAYTNTLIFTDHIEFIYLFLSPLYWVWNDVRMLILAQAFFISFSVVPIYLLATEKKLQSFLKFSLATSYLLFFGIQNAMWHDVHSLVFGASFLAWFIYFLDIKKTKWAFLFFFLTIFCKEDLAFVTFFVSLVYAVKYKDKETMSFILLSILYLFLVFFIYYPHFTHDGYRFESKNGFFSSMQASNYINTPAKRETFFYSLAWFGFLPLFSPLYLLAAFADITHYFILGQTVQTAQGIELHYRVTLAPLLALPTIYTLSKVKKLNTVVTGIYLLVCAAVIQYYLHLPLSYLAKSWFWHTPASVSSIHAVLMFLPNDASVVSEPNITPHIGHRVTIYTLWSTTKSFQQNSPCGKPLCPWFHWSGSPTYLIADTSSDWDIRELFQDSPQFHEALVSLTNMGVIKVYKQHGTAILFKVLKNPDSI